MGTVWYILLCPHQEREFLKNYVQRIVDVRPNLVLVEKTVSRIAQDMLLEHGITLVINMKPVSSASFLCAILTALNKLISLTHTYPFLKLAMLKIRTVMKL